MVNSSQLFLLADHIKLSLLERQRAAALNLQPSSGDSETSRSLGSLKDGLTGLEAVNDLDAGELRRQYNELQQQFDSIISAQSPSIVVSAPNSSALKEDFSQASDSRPRLPSSSSFKKSQSTNRDVSRSVRFRDDPTAEDTANRAALMPYHDEPDADDAPDHAALDNQQIHDYHKRVIQDQDSQLDSLGQSIGRTRELSIQIGDELDDQNEMLDEVDENVTRHQTQLDRAKNRLGKIARKAKDNMSFTIIITLVVILVLLIVVLK